ESQSTASNPTTRHRLPWASSRWASSTRAGSPTSRASRGWTTNRLYAIEPHHSAPTVTCASNIANRTGSSSQYAGVVTSTLELTVRRAGVVDYLAAWDEQRRVHAAVVAGEQPDTVLLLEHPSVYTAGKLTKPTDRPVDGTPVVETDR